MRSSKLATAALTVILALLVLSASIAVPILFRPFYYIQIDALRLPERTGWPEEVIREAYDEEVVDAEKNDCLQTGNRRYA